MPAKPPDVIRYRNRQSRVTNANRANINEYGLKIPSRNSRNYEPEIENGANLLSATYNYKNNAKKRRNNAWANYTRRRAAAAAAATGRRNNRKNGTRKSLFGNNGNGNRNNRNGNGSRKNGNGNNTRRTLFGAA